MSGNQYTKELNALVNKSQRSYSDLAVPGRNHVRLIITLDSNAKICFDSTTHARSFETINEAREKVAEVAVNYIKTRSAGNRPDMVESKQIKKSGTVSVAIPALKKNEWLQEMKNVLVDREGWTISEENYRAEESNTTSNKTKFRYTFSHPKILRNIVGDWSNSKKEAKQSVAKEVLAYYYQQKQGKK